MSSHFINTLKAQDAREVAAKRAKDALEAQGIYWPRPDSKMSPIENYARIMAYSQQEAELIVKYLNEITARPLELDNVKPKQEWGRSYYDN